MAISDFTPLVTDGYVSSKAPSDQRLGDQLQSLADSDFALLGYPDDQGIHLNGGRVGAAFGPDRARKYLYKMTRNPFSQKKIHLHDVGNLKISDDIGNNHEKGKEAVNELLTQNKKVISIGGGHDYAYPDGAAFLEQHANSQLKPIIINIDAHLDVRPLDKGLTSGTPFYRLLQEFDHFDFFEIGIQSQCNSKSHVDWLINKGGHILSYDELMTSGDTFEQACNQFLGSALLKKRPCFLSVDIDAFSSSFAMGCSQAWPTGLHPEPFLRWFEVIRSRLNITNLGVYELSPPLDLDDRTSKLVAQIIYRYLK